MVKKRSLILILSSAIIFNLDLSKNLYRCIDLQTVSVQAAHDLHLFALGKLSSSPRTKSTLFDEQCRSYIRVHISCSLGYVHMDLKTTAEPTSSVGSVSDLRTGGRWFDPRLGQYSFRELMIVIATKFIPVSPLPVGSTTVTWERSQWIGKNIVHSTGLQNSRKAWIGALDFTI